jgi:AcrR family transcriptional regulator
MSRTQDENLRDRILDVALVLLRLRGEDGVTMRAVAEAAETTTPTLYSRFPNKDALLLALAQRERTRYLEAQSRKRSLEDAARGYLDWELKHPHEYRLIYGSRWFLVLSGASGRPGLKWVQRQFALRFGGKDKDYEYVTSAIWMLLHGAASMLTLQPKGPDADFVRTQCLTACTKMIKAAGRGGQNPLL